MLPKGIWILCFICNKFRYNYLLLLVKKNVDIMDSNLINCIHASIVNILKVIKETIRYHEFQAISISVNHILHIDAILWFWAGLPCYKRYLRFVGHGLLHQEVFKQEQHIDILKIIIRTYQ